MTRRRRLVAGAALGALVMPLPGRAQPVLRPRLVGFLGFSTPQTGGLVVDGLKKALHGLGWAEGRDIDYAARWAESRGERLPALARELVALGPDVIVVAFTPCALAARQATATIPIVVNIADPVGSGLAQSLARPGGNVTGISNASPDVGPKLIDLLRGALPRVARVGVLWNPDNPSNAPILKNLQAGAESVGVRLVPIEARTLAEVEQALLRMSREPVEAVIVLTDGLFLTHGRRIGELLTRYRLPSALQGRAYLDLGGLMSYALNTEDSNRRAASYVDRILKGARPADLPIEQPTRFELVINVKAAKALGITIPRALLLRADEVIE